MKKGMEVLNATMLLSLLNRVEMLEHRQQDDAYTVGIDRVTKTASVKVNPDLLDTAGQHKARIRGAAELMLSGFRGYNRDMTRRYGTWGNEQQTFDRAYDQAREQIEGLLGEAYPYDLTEPLELRDITPATPAQAPADQGQAATAQPAQTPATDAGAVQAKDSADNTSLLGNVPTPPTGVPTVNAPQMPAQAPEAAPAPDATPVTGNAASATDSSAAQLAQTPNTTQPAQAPAADSPAPDATTVPAPVSMDFTEPQTAPATDNGSLTALPADATLNAPATDTSATQPADTTPPQATTDTSGQ